jgi:toxin ParE1/3/4
VPNVRFSKAALLDVDEILEYGTNRFGNAQAADYLDGLQRACELLNTPPNPGVECAAELGRKRRLWRLQYESHVVYYQLPKSGVFVVRVLHGSMHPSRHL